MKRKSIYKGLMMVLLVLLTGCSAKMDSSSAKVEPVEINISAAASLKDALGEIQVLYAKSSSDTLQFNFGGSGALQKQIEEGAPCDLFISASKSNMDTLEKGGFIIPETRKDLLGNQLVLITSKEAGDKVQSTDSLTSAEVKSIVIGTPESVPAGKYAKQTLTSLGLWDQLQDKIVLAKDVKQVLEYVETGNADCGFVYNTDALLLETGKVIPQDFTTSHDAIIYPVALIKEGSQVEAAQKFYDFLNTDTVKEIFKKYGFVVIE